MVLFSLDCISMMKNYFCSQWIKQFSHLNQFSIDICFSFSLFRSRLSAKKNVKLAINIASEKKIKILLSSNQIGDLFDLWPECSSINLLCILQIINLMWNKWIEKKSLAPGKCWYDHLISLINRILNLNMHFRFILFQMRPLPKCFS